MIGKIKKALEPCYVFYVASKGRLFYKFRLDRLFLSSEESRIKSLIIKPVEREMERVSAILGRKVESPDPDWRSAVLRKEKVILPRIVFMLTNRCTFQCKDCNNLMPYCKKKADMAIEDVLKEIDDTMQWIDECITVEVIGGEPFLYRELDEVLRKLKTFNKIHMIELTTNATVKIKESTLEILKDPKFYIQISNYGSLNKKKVEEMAGFLKSHGVNYKDLNNTVWTAPGGVEKRNKSAERLRYEYYHCYADRECRTIWNNKWYVCGRAPVLDDLGRSIQGGGYIDIEQIKNKEDIIRYYIQDTAQCCDYCDCAGFMPREIPSGVQVEARKEDK